MLREGLCGSTKLSLALTQNTAWVSPQAGQADPHHFWSSGVTLLGTDTELTCLWCRKDLWSGKGLWRSLVLFRSWGCRVGVVCVRYGDTHALVYVHHLSNCAACITCPTCERPCV